MLNHLLQELWQLSCEAAAVAIFVLALRGIFARALTPRWRNLLWFLVLGRLLIPTLPQSRVSLFNFESLFGNQKSAPEVLPAITPSQTTSIKIEYGTISNSPATRLQPATVKQPTPFWSNPPTLKYLWLTVAALILLRLIIANSRFASQLRRDRQETPAHLLALLRSCQQEIHLSRCPGLLVTNAVDSPAVAGVFRPRVLLPANSAATLSTEQIRLIFLHELAHIKSHDAAVDWLWSILQALHWFNPMLWLIAPLCRADRELARDEMVLRIIGAQHASLYGQTLLHLSQRANLPCWCPGLVGILTGKRRLQRRIKMIASFDGKNLATGWIGLALLIIAGCCAMTNPSSGETPTTLPSVAGNPTTAPTGAEEVETRKYDVSDLLFVVPNYNNAKTAPLATNAEADPERDKRMEDLKTYIEQNVADATWKDQGGDLGTIARSGSRPVFLIRQSRQNHLEIQSALDKLRQSWRLQVSIETRLILVDDDAARKMSADVRHRLAALAGAGKYRTDQLLNADELRQLMHAVQKNISTTSLTAPRLTLFDGQHAMLIVQTQQAYIDSMSTVIANEGGKSVTSYHPHIATTTASGVELQCAACVSPDRGSVFVDSQPKYSRLLAMEPEHWSGAPANVNATIQRAITVTYERSLACGIPNNQTLLLSGFTQTIQDSAAAQPAPGASAQLSIDQERHKQFYLLITPTILIEGKAATKSPPG